MVRHIVQLRVSQRFLAEALGLPKNAKLLGLRTDWDGAIIMGVEHESCPPVGEAELAPEANLIRCASALLVPARPITCRWSFAPEHKWPTRLGELVSPEAPEAVSSETVDYSALIAEFAKKPVSAG